MRHVPSALPRQIAERFEPIDCIGQGGAGVVYRARMAGDERIVALKVIAAKHLRDPARRRGFVREARAILRLGHRNVVKLIDFDLLTDGGAYLVTEYLAGGNLGFWRRRWPGWLPLLEVTEGILSALAYAHARGIVHCDIKPENLLLAAPEDGGHVALADFGVARLAAHSTSNTGTMDQWRTEELTGTPTYMAPEQAEGNLGAYGPWTDMYALGVVLHELVAGVPPFDADSVTGILLKHLQEPAPPMQMRDGVERLGGFVELVAYMLAKDPWDRPRFASRLRSAFLDLRDDAAICDARARMAAFDRSESSAEVEGPPTLPDSRDHEVPVAPTPPSDREKVRMASRRLDASSGFRRVRTRELSLVGRGDEMLELRNIADATLRDRMPNVVLLHSAPGLGKTRLIEALREVLEERGEMQSWTGTFRVDAGGVGAGLRGAVEAFYLCLGLSREQTEAALGTRLRKLRARDPWELGALMGWLRPSFDGMAGQVAPTDATSVGLALRAVRRACVRYPLLICMDDAHHALDALMLPFVERLLHAGQVPHPMKRRAGDRADPEPGLSCMVVLSYRTLDETRDPTGALRQRIAELAAQDRVPEIALGPMTNDGITRLLVDEVGLMPQQAERIAEQTGGRPFLALQAARAALEIGELQSQEASDDSSAELAIISDEYELTELARPVVVSPLSSGRLLREALEALLEDLPSTAGVRVLGMLALLSPQVSFATLSAALSIAWPAAEAADAMELVLERSMAAGLVRWQAQDEVLVLDHEPLTRALVRELERHGVAAEAHRAAAEALRRKFGDQHATATALRARHLAAARCPADAWALMYSAIEDAVAHARYRDAVALAAELQVWLDEWKEAPGSERRGQVHRALAWAAVHCGALHAAARHLDEELTRRTEDPRALAERAHLQARIHSGRGDIGRAIRAFATARTTYEQLGDRSGLGQALLGMASAFLSQGELDRALTEAEAALAVFASAGEHRGRAATLRVLGQISVMRGELERAETSYKQGLALFGSLGDIHGTADVQRGLAGLALERGDIDNALLLFRDALVAYETIGDLQGAANTLRGVARGRRIKGQTDVAIANLQRAVELFEQLGGALGVADCLLDLASIQREHGDYAEATDALDRAVACYQRANDDRGVASCLMTLGNVLLDAGKVDMALSRHEEALKIFWRTGYERGVLLARLNLGHAHLIAKTTQKARELLEVVETDATKAKEPAIAATAAAYRALAAAMEGDLQQAMACFERASEHGERAVGSSELAVSFEQLSDELIVIDDGAPLAVDVLAAAEREFQSAGQHGAQRRASRKRAELMARLGTQPQRR